ncbi:MAG: hypothetical protein ACT6Q5_13945 [Sphingopyxis solisilvae]|uniref:hypothetical protein n=1 Tax=Sphingopyxis solisilvae TaxID=1886788 RepID=UPI004035FE2C
MNFAPSEFPRLAGAARLSEPGFDILLAVAGSRQAAQPTVRMLRARATRRMHVATVNTLCQMFGRGRSNAEQNGPRVVRFFDLSDGLNGWPETMNAAFTRGFQPMLNPSDLETIASENFPPDDETME